MVPALVDTNHVANRIDQLLIILPPHNHQQVFLCHLTLKLYPFYEPLTKLVSQVPIARLVVDEELN